MNLTFNPRQEELFHQAHHSINKTVNLKSLPRAGGTSTILLALAVTSGVPTVVFLTDTPRHVFMLVKAHCPEAIIYLKSRRIEHNGVTILLRNFSDGLEPYRGLGNYWVVNDEANEWYFNAKDIKRFFRTDPRVMKIINISQAGSMTHNIFQWAMSQGLFKYVNPEDRMEAVSLIEFYLDNDNFPDQHYYQMTDDLNIRHYSYGFKEGSLILRDKILVKSGRTIYFGFNYTP